MNSVPPADPADAGAMTTPALAKTDASPAANADTAAEIAAATRNPLWIIVIGMACFCAVVVAVMSEGSSSAQAVPPTPTPIAPGESLGVHGEPASDRQVS